MSYQKLNDEDGEYGCIGCSRSPACNLQPHYNKNEYIKSGKPVPPKMMVCPCIECIVKPRCSMLCKARADYVNLYTYYLHLELNTGYKG